nr:hypothetical protein Iba_chr05cCG1940 [Ipomoea batatas]
MECPKNGDKLSDLEDVPSNAVIVAELLHRRLVLLLNPPPEFLGQLEHFVLLLLAELCSEPFLRRAAAVHVVHHFFSVCAAAGGGWEGERAVRRRREVVERVDASVLSGGQELAAAVHGVAADPHRVVPQALPVPRLPHLKRRQRAGAGAGAHGRHFWLSSCFRVTQRVITRSHLYISFFSLVLLLILKLHVFFFCSLSSSYT